MSEFHKTFGRGYGLTQSYLCEDADLILVTAGTIAGTCRVVADQCRARGLKVGVFRIRLFRPFPGEEISRLLRTAKKVAVIDRDFSPGCGGIFAQEVKSSLQGCGTPCPFTSSLQDWEERMLRMRTLERSSNKLMKRQSREESHGSACSSKISHTRRRPSLLRPYGLPRMRRRAGLEIRVQGIGPENDDRHPAFLCRDNCLPRSPFLP